MRISERYAVIEKIVNAEGSVSVANLKKYFPDISDMTLRRDLDALDKAERIIRVHGGARSIRSAVGIEDSVQMRSELHVEHKRKIARRAAGLLREHMAVFIDAGSTTAELCRLFPDGQYLVYTSGLNCALALQRLKKAEIYLLGGRFSSTGLCTNGSGAITHIENVHFTQAFLGSNGFEPSCGFTCENCEDARLKSEIIKRSEHSVILMDSSKLGRVSTYTFARLDDIDVVVSDSEVDEQSARLFAREGVELLLGCD